MFYHPIEKIADKVGSSDRQKLPLKFLQVDFNGKQTNALVSI
jgi:hypothetical protein